MDMSPDRIRRIRQRAGWTLQELGDTVGVARQTVWQWENGERSPDCYHEEVLQRIEQKLDEIERDRQKKEFLQEVGGLALTSGIGALLLYLYGDSNPTNSENTES